MKIDHDSLPKPNNLLPAYNQGSATQDTLDPKGQYLATI